MNEYRSRGETTRRKRGGGLLARAAGDVLARALRVFPVVVVTGARQTGKSTLVRTAGALRDRPYLTLDDLLIRDQALVQPEALDEGRVDLLVRLQDRLGPVDSEAAFACSS